MSIEVMKQALDALEGLFGIPELFTGKGAGDVAVWRLGGWCRAEQAITALRQAIAEAEKQEPVRGVVLREGLPTLILIGDIKPTDQRLYTHPPKPTPLTDEQVRKVARLFSNRIAEMCDVDAEDHWKYHGEEVVADVDFVLKAAIAKAEGGK